jgi:GalNAc-alpha-(1->4)-GalNAc-alpha-(1->3)-diNAcBac-PP-undecaprenol alpha-1,4-N-acetyl-D-galactosaminyltransferase
MRVALLISSLGPGGAERVMSLLADGLVARGHEVSLITLSHAGKDFYALDPRVQRRGLGLLGDSTHLLSAIHANIRRIRALRRAIRTAAPEVVLAFVTHMNVLALIACVGLRARVVVSERVDPTSHSEGRLWQALRTLTYRRADAVVVQTESVARWFRARSWRRERVIVIPNPVMRAAESAQAQLLPPRPFVLGAGRLVHQKGFDILIRAFGLLAAGTPQLRLVIAGEGPDAQQLRQLAAALGLESRVLFLGNVENLSALMRSAEAFVLSSRYEGFPNVLLEALASGLPVVSTDCPSGPREILRDGEFGLLVPCENPPALADALRRVATDADLRRRLSGMGSRATAAYAVDRVVAEWEGALSGRGRAERLP